MKRRGPPVDADTAPAIKQTGVKKRGPFDADRQRLPVYEARSAILDAVSSCETLVLTGDTGCGKTTQIPQFLLEAGYGQRGLIGVTQPRRVAAISVANRVASEMAEEVGQTVGYCVRFDDCTGESTRLRYMTDGMLLREATSHPLLRRYSVIIVDEAHERSLQTDMMLALLKRAQRERRGGGSGGSGSGNGGGWGMPSPLKIVVMSATLDTATFCRYFASPSGDDALAVQVLGRTFPVSVYYSPAPMADYLEAAVTAILQVHTEEPPGDILVFLTGQDDIEAVGAAVRQRAAALAAHASQDGEGAPGRALDGDEPGGVASGGAGRQASPLTVLPLYAALPPAAQLKALRPAIPGVRKVILATNIAETSLTIDGVVYVIDAGLAKVRMYHAGKRIDSLLACPISRAQARQRAGRAGRVQPGKCFRLYTEDTYLDLAERAVPEIQRTSLAAAILALKVIDALCPPALPTGLAHRPCPPARGRPAACPRERARTHGEATSSDRRPPGQHAARSMISSPHCTASPPMPPPPPKGGGLARRPRGSLPPYLGQRALGRRTRGPTVLKPIWRVRRRVTFRGRLHHQPRCKLTSIINELDLNSYKVDTTTRCAEELIGKNSDIP